MIVGRRAVPLAVLVLMARIASPNSLDDRSFKQAVRPMMQRAGCAAGTCHASGMIGLILNPADNSQDRDLGQVLRHVRPGKPASSPLYVKALGSHHLGGRTIDPESCEAALLRDWIRGARNLRACPAPSRATQKDDLPSVLRGAMPRCSTSHCHGRDASLRFADPDSAGGSGLVNAALAPALNRFVPSRSRLLAVLGGDHDHPRLFASSSEPPYRQIYAWIAETSPVGSDAPRFDAFVSDVEPILAKRGCMDASCHGAPGDLVLVDAPDAVLDNYLRLVPRIASGLFPAKPQNLRAHGGGRRLGSVEDDCAMATIAAWMNGTAPGPCKPRPLPDRARFASVVQPSLEALTCPKCHADEKLGFRFVARPDAADLERNYQSVLAKIDLDYPPVSSVLLRVREDCMQARIMAWIDRQPDPGCKVELRNFKGSFPSRTQ